PEAARGGDRSGGTGTDRRGSGSGDAFRGGPAAPPAHPDPAVRTRAPRAQDGPLRNEVLRRMGPNRTWAQRALSTASLEERRGVSTRALGNRSFWSAPSAPRSTRRELRRPLCSRRRVARGPLAVRARGPLPTGAVAPRGALRVSAAAAKASRRR